MKDFGRRVGWRQGQPTQHAGEGLRRVAFGIANVAIRFVAHNEIQATEAE